MVPALNIYIPGLSPAQLPVQPSLMFDNLIKREPLITLLISRILYLVAPYILNLTGNTTVVVRT